MRRTCLAAVAPRPAVVRTRPVPVAASGEHDGVLRLAIVAWKEEGRAGLLRPLAHLLAAPSSRSSAPRPARWSWSRCRPPAAAGCARGADVVDQLARQRRGLLRSTGVDVTARQALRVARRTADQAGLDAQAARRNLAGAFALRSPRASPGATSSSSTTSSPPARPSARPCERLGAAAIRRSVRPSIAHRPRR